MDTITHLFLMFRFAFYSFTILLWNLGLAQNHTSRETVTSNSSQLQMVFPENEAYEAHELRYFQWEHELVDDFEFQLTLNKDEVVILDTLLSAPVSEIQYADTVIYFEPFPSENRYDLKDLLEPSQSYQWTLTASNGTNTQQLEGSFEILASTKLSNKTVGFVDSSFFHIDYYYDYIIPINEHGNITDLNLTIDLAKGIEFINAASDERLSVPMYLISPSGTKVKLMDYSFSDPAIHHRRTFDDEAFLSTAQYDAYVSELSAWNDFYNNGQDAQLSNTNQRPDFCIKPEELLNQFKDEDAFGNWRLTWLVYDRFRPYFKIDPNFIQLDITIKEHPIQLGISDWTTTAVSLNWQTENTYDQFLLEKYADGATTPSSTITIGTLFDHEEAFQDLDTAFKYRIIGQKGAQQELSNIIRVKSPLDTPRFAAEYELITAFANGSWIPAVPGVLWTRNIETGFIAENETRRYDNLKPYRGRFRAFHEFDTSAWSDKPNPILQLYFPTEDTVLSNTQIASQGITFQWSSNVKYEAVEILVDRLNDNNTRTRVLRELYSISDLNDKHEVSFSQQEEFVQELSIPGAYSCSLCFGEQFPPNSCLDISTNFFVDQILTTEITSPTIQIRPNPTNQFVSIENEGSPIHEIKIYSLSGKLLLQKSVDQHRIELDIRSLDAGLHLIHITSADKTTIRKLLKQ